MAEDLACPHVEDCPGGTGSRAHEEGACEGASADDMIDLHRTAIEQVVDKPSAFEVESSCTLVQWARPPRSCVEEERSCGFRAETMFQLGHVRLEPEDDK